MDKMRPLGSEVLTNEWQMFGISERKGFWALLTTEGGPRPSGGLVKDEAGEE